MTSVHLMAAQFCFVVYLMCEARCLSDKSNITLMAYREYKLRLLLLICGVSGISIFGLVYLLLSVFSGGSETPYVKPPFIGKSEMYKYLVKTHQYERLRP